MRHVCLFVRSIYRVSYKIFTIKYCLSSLLLFFTHFHFPFLLPNQKSYVLCCDSQSEIHLSKEFHILFKVKTHQCEKSLNT